MTVTRHEIVHWFTTPERLRELATQMEEHWKTCSPGQDKTVAVEWGKDTALHILVDQDRIKSPGWEGRMPLPDPPISQKEPA